MHTPDHMPRPVALNLKRILRGLILLEIGLGVSTGVMSLFQDGFLPPMLQEYQASAGEAGGQPWEWLLFGLGIPALVLYVVSCVALWRGWRMGRLLYTFGWVVSLPAGVLLGPSVQTGLTDGLDSFTSAAGGAILGLLYFSDLRHLYSASPRLEPGVEYGCPRA